MREASKDIIRLEHIIQAIERIKRYTLGKRFDDLVKDDMMYYAVVKNIEIMQIFWQMNSKVSIQIHNGNW